MNLKVLTLFPIVLLLSQLSCSSYSIRPNISAEERFELAKGMFSNKDYLEAKTQFKIITLNNPGINFIDEAQFYLADSHFHMKEYIIAADEYNRLTRLYPRSQWTDDAHFKIALCDFKLSPKPSLDQKYTYQAILHLQSFLEDFPGSELVPEAEKLLAISRGKIAQKELKTGDLYRRLSAHFAALVYYNSVLDNYYDTEFAEGALFWKGECLFRLNRHDEGLEAFQEYVKRYEKSKKRSDAQRRIEKIQSELAKIKEANGRSQLSSQTNNK